MLVENTAADGGKVQPHKVLSQQTHQSCRLIWEQLLCSIGAIHEPHFVIDHMKQAIGTALQDSTIHWGCSGWRARVQPEDTKARTNQSTTRGRGLRSAHKHTDSSEIPVQVFAQAPVRPHRELPEPWASVWTENSSAPAEEFVFSGRDSRRYSICSLDSAETVTMQEARTNTWTNQWCLPRTIKKSSLKGLNSNRKLNLVQ